METEANALDQDIIRKVGNLTTLENTLNEAVNAVVPAVVNHFNIFLEFQLNPCLPPGYGMQKSVGASFEGGFFTLYPGDYITPKGVSRGPLGFENIVLDMFEKYKNENPWVDRIAYKFIVSK